MQLGIIGLPRSGKTTVFSALVGRSEDRGYGRRETHVGTVAVPDPRLPALNALFKREREIPAIVEYVDAVGLESGGAKKGYDEALLKSLAPTNALLLVLRGFDADDGTPPDPLREFTSAEEEFLLNDLMLVENRLHRLDVQIKKQKNPALEAEHHLLQQCLVMLESNAPLRMMTLDAEQEKTVRGFQLLSLKPLLAVVNLGETYAARGDEWLAALQPKLTAHSAALALQGELELEIAELEEAERAPFLQELGIAEPAAHRVIRESYRLLNLITFFTVGDHECRAWTIPEGTTALGAAAVVHSDMARGFIRVEVSRCDDVIRYGGFAALKEKGLLRLEGKEHIVHDGDVLLIRFAV